jgi:hypothetical protein
MYQAYLRILYLVKSEALQVKDVDLMACIIMSYSENKSLKNN